MDFVMRKQWSREQPGAEIPPLAALTAHDHTALRLKRRRGGGHGRSVTVATHAGLQSHKQRYEGIWWGPSVTTNGNK